MTAATSLGPGAGKSAPDNGLMMSREPANGRSEQGNADATEYTAIPADELAYDFGRSSLGALLLCSTHRLVRVLTQLRFCYGGELPTPGRTGPGPQPVEPPYSSISSSRLRGARKHELLTERLKQAGATLLSPAPPDLPYFVQDARAYLPLSHIPTPICFAAKRLAKTEQASFRNIPAICSRILGIRSGI